MVWCPLRGAVHVYLSVAQSVVRPGGPGSRLSLPPPRGGLAVRGECRLASPPVERAPYARFWRCYYTFGSTSSVDHASWGALHSGQVPIPFGLMLRFRAKRLTVVGGPIGE